jgi:hypothetical protein
MMMLLPRIRQYEVDKIKSFAPVFVNLSERRGPGNRKQRHHVFLCQIGGNGKQALRHHPVGNVGNITLAGEPVESPRMNKDDSFFVER